MSSRRILRIIGPMRALESSSGSILVSLSAMFQTPNTSLSMYFFCSSKTHVITFYSDHVCVILCVNDSVLYGS
jgi:hypothetical protein